MPVTAVTSDPEALTMTLVGEFAAPVDRLWRAFTEPAQLERFWGPPGYPSTFREFDFAPGGRASYVMTSPKGERFGGVWEFVQIDDGTSFTVLDSFADEHGVVNADMPTGRMVFTFEATDAGSRGKGRRARKPRRKTKTSCGVIARSKSINRRAEVRSGTIPGPVAIVMGVA